MIIEAVYDDVGFTIQLARRWSKRTARKAVLPRKLR